LYQTLKQCGYKMFIFNAEEGRLIPVSVEDVQDRFVNVIATKQPAMVLARLEE
jgi:uncharacterized radical SAM superfamily Fe-S cluster-containing enzyme